MNFQKLVRIDKRFALVAALLGSMGGIGAACFWAFNHRPVFLPDLKRTVSETKEYHDKDMERHVIVEDLKMRALAAEIVERIEFLHHQKKAQVPVIERPRQQETFVYEDNGERN